MTIHLYDQQFSYLFTIELSASQERDWFVVWQDPKREVGNDCDVETSLLVKRDGFLHCADKLAK